MKTRRLITYEQLKPEKGIPFSRTHLSRLYVEDAAPIIEQTVAEGDNGDSE